MSSTGHLPELESLRSQVADLARELAERDQAMQARQQGVDGELQDLRKQSDLLRAIMEGTAADTGDDFFASLAAHLTSTLHMQYAVIGEILDGTPARIRTVAVSSRGQLLDNFEYDLAQAPCGTGLTESFWCFTQDVQTLFPNFPPLAAMGVESHSGVSIRDKQGKVVGLIVVMDTQPIAHQDRLQTLLQVFAPRVAAELQRKQAEAARRETERRLRFTQFAVDHAVDGVLWADDSKRFIYANTAVCRSLGYSREELLSLGIADIAPLHDPERFQRRLDEIKQGTPAIYESIHRRKDGSEFPVEVSITFLEHEGKGYTCGIIRDITERRRIEQERLHALHNLQNIMDTVPDFMFTLDTRGNLVKWNRRVGEVTGYSAEELLNKPALDFVPPEEQDRTAAAIRKAFTEGYAELDGHLLTKERRLIPYHWTGALLKDPYGEPIGITGVGRDVSEKKRADEALQRQQSRLVEAQALAHLGSWEWDIDTGDTTWSDEQFRIFGHEPQAIEITYDTFLAALLPDDHDRVLGAVNDALLGKAPYDIDCRIVRPTGEVRTIYCRGEVARGSSGHPLRMSGTVLDITDRKQIEEALRASEERWHLAVQGSHDGIWDWNIPAGAIFFSARWKAMRGFQDHELLNHIDEWRSRIHPDDLDRVLQSIDNYLAKRSADFCEEYRVQRKDGSYMWILDRGAAIWAEGGSPLRMAGSESDITERKRAEEALAQSRDLLASFVEHTPAAVAMLDKDFRYLAVSQRWLQDYRLGDQSLTGKHHYDVFPEIRHMTEWHTIHQRCLAGSVERRDEDRFVREDGSEDWLRWEVRPWHDVSGEISGIIMFTEVITERKRAEEALRTSQEKLQQALRASHTGLWDWNTNTNEASLSREWKHQLGYEETELSDTFESWETLLHPEDHDRVIGYVRAYLASPAGDYQQEFRLRHKDGTYRWIEARAAFVTEPDGRRVRLLGSHTDVTERKQIEEDLHRSKAQLSDIMENHPAVVYTRRVGDEWPFTFVTPNIFGLLGYTSIDIISDAGLWDNLMHPDDLAKLMAQTLPSFLRKGAETFVTRLRHRDGQYRWIENQARLTHLGDGPLLMVGTMTDITERKRAEVALRESEARTRSILETALDAVISINDRGRITGWNPQAEVMFGYSPHEVLGLPLDETIIPARYRQAHAHGMSRMLQSGDGSAVRRRFEFFALHRDGHEFPVEFAIASTQIDGRPMFSAFVRDITERTQAETALRESEERYRTLIELSPSGVFVFCEGRIVYVNSMTVTLLGATGPNDILERPPFDFIHPDYHEDIANNLRRILAGEATVHRAERVYLKVDGTPIHVQVEAVRMTWNGKPAIQEFFSDITERKQMEDRLRTTQYVVDHAADSIFVIGHDGHFRDVNESACRRLGYTKQELLTMSVMDIDPDFLPAAWETFWADFKRTKQVHLETRHRSKSGEIFPVEVIANYLLHNGQELDCAIVRDITERKRVEEALQRSERQLRTVLDTLPIGVWFTDEKGHVLYGNPVGQRIWADAARVGLPQPGGDRLWWETIDHTESLHRWAVGTVLARGHDVPNEMLEIETHRGDRRTIRNSAVPVKGDAGEILGAIVLNENITDRVRAEQALRQEHALLMAVMDAATDIIFVKDIAGRYIHMNRAGAQRLGMAVEEVIGWNEYALWPSDLAASCQLADRRVLESGEPITVEETSVSAGKTTTYLTTKAPYRDPEGRIVGVIGVARDITERKQAEEALRASEERFAKAFRSSPYPIIISEVESGLFIDANDAAFRSFGYRPEEVTNRTSTELQLWPTPDHRRRFVEHLQQAGAIRNLEMDLRMRSGELRHCLVSAELIELHGKRCMVTVGSDITEQKRAEKELLKSHAFIRQIIDTDPNFIFAKDLNGRFTLVNKAVADAYGTTVDNLIGKTDADFNKNAEEVAYFLRRDRDVMKHLQDQFIPEERITDATGTIRWLQTVKRPILDESGQATMVLGAATDITERKQMEEALRQRERDLRAAIDERERISQDLHDGILQSLYAVGLDLEACKPLMTQRHYKKAVATMSEAIGQLNHVMSEVRNFIAGLESQVLQGSTFPAALQEMVNTLAATHPLRCTVTVDETAAEHISTQQALHLLNIVREALSNSLRHAQATKATVTLKPLSRCIRLSIADNGIGFDPASMRGVGHGLTNMAARARKVGGRFAIRSVPQHGTRITIDLPKENSHDESESEHDSTPARR